MSSAGSRTEAGTTLFEALVVMTIAVLVSAIAFPNIAAGLDRGALRLQTRTLSADLARARADAIRSGRPVVFSVTADGRTYAWTGSAPRRVSANVAVRAPGRSPVFFPDGAAAPAELRLETARAARTLSIDAVTGAVESDGA